MCDVYKTSPQQLGLWRFCRVRESSGSYCPQRGLISIPTEVSFEQASFVEPTNCLKAVKAQIALVNQLW